MGSFASTLTNDFAVLDDPITVTYLDVSGSATFSVAGVQRYAIDAVELEHGEGLFQAGDTIFELPVVNVSFDPATDDVITEPSGKVWNVVQKVGKVVWDTVWQLVCRPQR